MELCPELGIAIPVGKDSLSMKTVWRDGAAQKSVVAPVSLIVSAFAPVADVRRTLTPQLATDVGATRLLWIDLGEGRARLGASILAQVYGELGANAPDLDGRNCCRVSRRVARGARTRPAAGLPRRFRWRCVRDAGGDGLRLPLRPRHRVAVAAKDFAARLFAEEAGAVVQLRAADVDAVRAVFATAGLAHCVHDIGAPATPLQLRLRGGEASLQLDWIEARRAWSETSHRMRLLRDDPQSAHEEFAAQLDVTDPGLQVELGFDPQADIAAPYINRGARPRWPCCASRA